MTTTVDSEFHFTDSDFSRVRSMIHRRAGIALGEQKRQMVYSRLSRRLREIGWSDFSSYLQQLESDPHHEEWQAFINALTTNLTAFFREAHHFPVLAQRVRQAKQPVTVWCAAASTGEEPYSIAMTLLETLGASARNARVIATDIDTAVLATAARGIYSLEQVGKLPAQRLKRFFQRGVGANAGKARVHADVKALVEFARLNLLDPSWSVKEPVDAIFCRNVMIYFDKPTQARILARFVPLLKPHGLLFAGHSENASLLNADLKPIGQTVYELAGRKALVRP